MADERRLDPTARERIDAIEAGYIKRANANQDRLDKLEERYQKVAHAVFAGIAVTVLSVVLAAVGVFLLLARIQDSRRTGLGVSCGIASAVVDAGRAVITGSSASSDPVFLRNLEKLGYPPKKVRDEQARQLAEKYTQVITDRVAKQAGAHTAREVLRGGRLDCAAVERASGLG